MPTRPTLDSARQRFRRILTRSQEALADRVIIREPLSEAEQQYVERRVRELGLGEKADQLRH